LKEHLNLPFCELYVIDGFKAMYKDAPFYTMYTKLCHQAFNSVYFISIQREEIRKKLSAKIDR
jgi:hypothetical protein